jgi:hypothetical protein
MGLYKAKIKEILAKYPEARKIAVENFLISMSGDRSENQSNLELDTNLYHWNADTVNAITEGIYEEDELSEAIDAADEAADKAEVGMSEAENELYHGWGEDE